jgi:hypothetical protein
MKFPLRHLEKLIDPNISSNDFETANEDLELFIETLRELEKCRKSKVYLKKEFNMELFLSSNAFNDLLQIREIDMIETPTKSGDVERISLKKSRQREDPVSVSDLNAALRELNRDLLRIQEIEKKEFEKFNLAQDVSENSLEQAWQIIISLRNMKGNWLENILNIRKKKEAKQKMKKIFSSSKIDFTGNQLDQIQKELAFFRQCSDLSQKWNPIGLNLISCLQKGTLDRLIQNIQEMGSTVWTSVYNGQKLPKSLEIAGIDFGDIRTIFENSNLAPLKESSN